MDTQYDPDYLSTGVMCGNTYVMKPSERDPTACMALVELFKVHCAVDL